MYLSALLGFCDTDMDDSVVMAVHEIQLCSLSSYKQLHPFRLVSLITSRIFVDVMCGTCISMPVTTATALQLCTMMLRTCT